MQDLTPFAPTLLRLADLMTLFKNDLRLALAAYNAGENAAIQYGNQIPPYRETPRLRRTVGEGVQHHHRAD
jgi:soluble lytic murein transglycosylase-like protein